MTLENLISYVVQAGAILVAGLLAPRLVRLKSPGWILRYWQVLLAVVLTLPLLQPWRVVDGGTATVDVAAAGVVKRATTSVFHVAGLTPLQWCLMVVVVVAFLRLIWLVAGLIVLENYRRRAEPLIGFPTAAAGLARSGGLHADILVSDNVHAPVTFGWRRPTILVPRGYEDLPREQQTGIAYHEMLHVVRRDWPVLVSEQILRAVLWFHPAVHILLRRIWLSREQLIDREVVRITGLRRQYLDALWNMARAQRAPAVVPALFLLNRSDLFERVALLAEEAHMSKRRVRISGLAMVAIVVFVGTSVAAIRPFVTTGSAGGPPPIAVTVDEEENGEQKRYPDRWVKEGELTEPKAIHRVNPRYPEEARKERIQGEVVCEAIIKASGEVFDPRILASDHEVFEQPTIDAISQWIFEPSRTQEGEAVDVLYQITMNYRLE